MTSVFASYSAKAWPLHYSATIHVGTIAGGTPTDEKVAEGWLKSKVTAKDDVIMEMVAETMAERGIPRDEALAQVDALKHLNGFKRHPDNGLYIEHRQVKACIKEAASVAVASGKLNARGWGKTNKGLLSYLAEHVHVSEEKIWLGVTEPTGITQRFVHTWRGTGIQYEEYVEGADLSFTVLTDHQFTDDEWAMLWLTAEQQGIGASRSQGFGRFEVTRWESVKITGAGTPARRVPPREKPAIKQIADHMPGRDTTRLPSPASPAEPRRPKARAS